ncbi:hypothetical protein Holit_02299 [Hollandina sp. SP2]
MADILQPQMGLNFEQVWAALMQLKEAQQETDRRMKELERLIQDLRDEGKETNWSMEEFCDRFGNMDEHLLQPHIIQKFNALGCHFTEASKVCKFYNLETMRVVAMFDMMLENDTYSIGVTVRTEPDEQDVIEHIRCLEYLKSHQNEEGDKRSIRGTLVGVLMPEAVRHAALSAGLYVIEQSGDTVKIEEPPHLRVW